MAEFVDEDVCGLDVAVDKLERCARGVEEGEASSSPGCELQSSGPVQWGSTRASIT